MNEATDNDSDHDLGSDPRPERRPLSKRLRLEIFKRSQTEPTDLNVPLVLSCELIGGGRWSHTTAG